MQGEVREHIILFGHRTNTQLLKSQNTTSVLTFKGQRDLSLTLSKALMLSGPQHRRAVDKCSVHSLREINSPSKHYPGCDLVYQHIITERTLC